MPADSETDAAGIYFLKPPWNVPFAGHWAGIRLLGPQSCRTLVNDSGGMAHHAAGPPDSTILATLPAPEHTSWKQNPYQARAFNDKLGFLRFQKKTARFLNSAVDADPTNHSLSNKSQNGFSVAGQWLA
jgi:hypothetical protein